MAWTPSTPYGGKFAVSMHAGRSQQYAANALAALGKGDISRGAIASLAAFLTLAGVAVPLLPHEVLSCLLFLIGAALALFIWATQPAVAVAPLEPVKTVVSSSCERRLKPAQGLFSELFRQPDAATLTDRAALARLTAQMSHELRTPLNAVLGFSELMANEVCGPLGASCYAQYARDIHASGRILLKSAEDALAITSVLTATERRSPRPARLAEIVDDALSFHADDLKRLSVSVEITAVHGIDVLAEVQTARQLIINMIADLCADAGKDSVLTITGTGFSDAVELELRVRGTTRCAGLENGNFSMTLARTLAELAGFPLTESIDEEGCRVLRAHFTSAAQHDFFVS